MFRIAPSCVECFTLDSRVQSEAPPPPFPLLRLFFSLFLLLLLFCVCVCVCRTLFSFRLFSAPYDLCQPVSCQRLQETGGQVVSFFFFVIFMKSTDFSSFFFIPCHSFHFPFFWGRTEAGARKIKKKLKNLFSLLAAGKMDVGNRPRVRSSVFQSSSFFFFFFFYFWLCGLRSILVFFLPFGFLLRAAQVYWNVSWKSE